jgi:hypothetical protein
MEEPQVERRKLVTLPQVEFEAMLERAAERGARHALSEVGLDGPEAARDISELRSLLDAFNEAKKTAGCEVRRETASIRSDASEARLRDSASIARRRRCLPKKAAENVLWVYAAALDAMCRPSRQLGTL